MELKNEIYRLNKLHKLIKMQNTGTPQELANRLHISKRHLYNVLDDLKMLGAKIGYSRNNCTFYYKNHFDLNLYLQVEYLDENEKKHIFAGNFLYNELLVHRRSLYLQS